MKKKKNKIKEAKSKRIFKGEKGITLIALVITIVILIILATVTLNVVLGEGGLIQRAQLAKELTEQAVLEEQEGLNSLMDQMTNIMAEEQTRPTIPENWDTTKVTPTLSDDNKYVPVPKGYIPSKATGETSVNDGFVIYEGTEEVNDSNVSEEKTSRNQFVWVPVTNISDMYGTDSTGKKWGKLYEFDENGITPVNWTEIDGIMTITDIRDSNEPNVVTGGSSTSYDADKNNLQEAGLDESATVDTFKAQLEEEFNNMLISVEKYGGFYIGRYETGDLSQNEAVIVKGNSDISNQTWYKMYRLSKEISANSNVSTTIIFGSQWDAVMRWLYNSGDEDKKTFTYNSTGKGNYGYVFLPTGERENYKINNIYDMAGNAYEATIEIDTKTVIGRESLEGWLG